MIITAPNTMSAETKIFFEWEPKNNQNQASVFVKSLPLLLGYSYSGFPTENLECSLGSFILDGPGTLVCILQPCKTARELNRSSGCRLPIVHQHMSQKEKWYSVRLTSLCFSSPQGPSNLCCLWYLTQKFEIFYSYF